MKKGKKLIIIALCISLMFSGSVSVGFGASKATEEIKTSDLFYGYPYYLEAQISKDQTDTAWNADYRLAGARQIADDTIAAVGKNMGDGIMSVITAFQNTDYVFNEIMASFGLSDSMEEKCMDEATEQLLMQIVQDGNYAKTMVELFDVGVNTWDMLQKGANLLEATEYVELPSGKKAAIGKAVEGQSEIFDMVDMGVSMIEMGNYIAFLEEVDNALLEYMLEVVEREDLKAAIRKVISYKNSNYQNYIEDKYLKPEVISKAGDLFTQYAGLTDINYAVVIADVFYGVCGSVMSAVTGLGSAEDLLVAMKLADYANAFSEERKTLITRFKTEPIQPEAIGEYKMCYDLQIAATKAYINATINVDRSNKATLSGALRDIKNYVSYDKHLEGCKTAIQSIDREDRITVSGNPDLYYEITKDMRIAMPTDEIKPDEVYLFEDTIPYSVRATRATLNFPMERCILQGNAELKGAFLTIPEGHVLEIEGDIVSDRIGYDWNSTDAISQITVDGTMKLEGSFSEKSHYPTANYTNLTVRGRNALVEIYGDVSSNGNWNMEEGMLRFYGQNVKLVGNHHYYTSGLQDIGNGTLQLLGGETGTIELPLVEITGNGTDSMQIQIRKLEDGYYFENLDDEEVILSAEYLRLKKKYQLEGGTYDVNDVYVSEYGILDIKQDLVFKGNFGNWGRMIMVTDNHVVVEDRFRTLSRYDHNELNLLTDGVIELKGDLDERGDNGCFGGSKNHEVRLTGTGKQNIYTSCKFNKLIIENESAEGVDFTGLFRIEKLFRHNRNAFDYDDIYAEVPDFDDDKVKDHQDLDPLDPALGRARVNAPDPEDYDYTGEAICPEIIVTDNLGNVLQLGRDYRLQYVDNIKPGDATLFVHGRGVYTGRYVCNFDILCDHVFGEDEYCDICDTRDPDIHVCDPRFVGEVAATCTERSIAAHYACECGKWYRDKAATVEITDTKNWGVPEKGHNWKTVKGSSPTCTSYGYTDGEACSRCGKPKVYQQPIPMLPHTEAYKDRVEPNCYTTGTTAGVYCAVCYQVLQGMIELPVAHKEVYLEDRPSTCMTAGETGGSYCGICGITMKASKPLPLGDHDLIRYNGYAATCTEEGLTPGSFCLYCNRYVEIQKPIPAKGHTEVVIPGKAATTDEDGLTAGKKCSACHIVFVEQEVLPKLPSADVGPTPEQTPTPDPKPTVAAVKSMKLAKASVVYTGKAQKVKVIVKDTNGKPVSATNYTVTYKNNVKVGKATATVKFKGNYSGTKTLTFKINPKAPTIKKPVAAKKAVTVKWSKVNKEATGYEVMAATNKKFTQGKKTVTIKKAKTTSTKVTKLKAKKTYYVKVRTYKTVKGVKYYSAWSAVKTVKTR